jgi:hypothetical protein
VVGSYRFILRRTLTKSKSIAAQYNDTVQKEIKKAIAIKLVIVLPKLRVIMFKKKNQIKIFSNRAQLLNKHDCAFLYLE